MHMKFPPALIFAFLLASCGGDDFTADCGVWGEFIECRELNELETGVWNEVRECMDIPDELPTPMVVIVEGTSISCGDTQSSGCQIGGFIGFPENQSDVTMYAALWKHEFTHEILDLTTGRPDRKHRSEWFTSKRCISE